MKRLSIFAILLTIYVCGCTQSRTSELASPTALQTQPPEPTDTMRPTDAPSPTIMPSNTPLPTPTPLNVIPRVIPVQPQMFDLLGDQISPLLYGTSYWYVSTSEHWPDLALKLLSGNKISVIRMGASSEDLVHVSDKEIDEFIGVCQSIGAEPLIQIRLLKTTPREAARIVRYVNLEKEYNVTFWSIGNEPDIWQDQGKTAYSVTDLIHDWREYAIAMKEVDPGIVLIGPDLSWKWKFDHPSHDWITPFVRANADLLDVVSVHYYPSTSSRDASVSQLLNTPYEFQQNITALANQLRRISDKAMPIAVTEFNLTWDWQRTGDNSGKSFWAGLWLADMYGRMIYNNVYMGIFWSGYAGDLSLIAPTDRPRATYYAQSAFRNFGSIRVATQSAYRNISIYAGKVPETGYVTLVITSHDDEAITTKISFELVADGLSVDIGAPTIHDILLPPYSITSLVFDEQIQLVERMSYTQEMWQSVSPPEVTGY